MDNVGKQLPAGKKFLSQGRTISEGDFTLLVNLNWTTVSIHTDAQYMKSSQFGERILPGVCVLSTAIGLANTSDLRRSLRESNLRLVALLGFEKVGFTAPTFPGDTLTVESEVLEVRPTSKPKRNILRIRDVARKQTGEEVMESIRLELHETVQ